MLETRKEAVYPSKAETGDRQRCLDPQKPSKDGVLKALHKN